MKLAVMLITSNRSELTERTLKTFWEHLPKHSDLPFDVTFVHGDDASADPTNSMYAAAHGFKTIHETPVHRRLGAHAMRRAMILQTIKKADPTHIMVLENDWESVRSVPWAAIKAAFERDDVYAFRLYHEHKQEDRTRPTGPEHAGRKHLGKEACAANWKKIELAGEQCEIGDIHFGAPPCVFRVEELVKLHTGTKSDSEAMRLSGKIKAKTVRVTENVVWHIGTLRTPGFRK